MIASPTTITTTTANICGNPLRAKRFVRRRMRRALRQPGAVLGQEIARSNRWRRHNNYNAMWRNVAAVYGKRTHGGPREVPISAPLGWDPVGSNVILVHDGKRRVSPSRYITVARYVMGGRRVAFVNCHPVSKPRLGVPFARWRMSRWDEYFDTLVGVVAELHAEGYTVVFGGDMNKPVNHMPQVHPDQARLIGAGLDGLWCVPTEGVTVHVIRRRKIGRTLLMDHPILTVTFELREAG